MNEIIRDILTVKENSIICHQVNCQKIMGAGLAKALSHKFPNLYQEYVDFSDKHTMSMLGSTQIVTVSARNNLHVANVFGQFGIGSSRIQTNYNAVEQAMNSLRNKSQEIGLYDWQIYFPYKMGCGLAGGTWPIYKAIIKEYFPNGVICIP